MVNPTARPPFVGRLNFIYLLLFALFVLFAATRPLSLLCSGQCPRCAVRALCGSLAVALVGLRPKPAPCML